MDTNPSKRGIRDLMVVSSELISCRRHAAVIKRMAANVGTETGTVEPPGAGTWTGTWKRKRLAA
jgi:hypothetical protein